MTAHNRPLADRYTIARTEAGKEFILTKASTTVINALSQRYGRSYQDLSRITGLPVNTLMVYAQRMEGAGLAKRSQVMQRSRLRTLVFLAQGVSINYNTGRIVSMTNEHNNAAQTDWRELCRRLYVELWHCNKQMTGGPRPRWTQGSTVRDVLRDASLALEATPAAAAAPAEPFGYFRVDALGWTDCAATDEGAIALYERPAAPAVPNVLKRGYGRLIQAAADLALQQFMPSDIVDDYPSKTISAAKVAKMMTQPRDRLRLLSIEVSEGAKQMLAATPATPSQEHAVNLSCRSTQARLAAQWGYVPAPSQPAVPQGEPVYQLARATGPVADAWIDVAKDVYDDAGFHPSDFKRRILYAAPSQPAVPQGIPAHEVIDAIEAWKSAWAKVPPFGNKVNKATREAITFSHNTLFQLLWSAQQAQRMPKACPTPTGCGPHGCRGACITVTTPAPSQPVTLTDGMVTAGARALCDIAADSCNVDREDNWNMYGDVYKSDAKACIIAALREKGELR